MLTQTSELAIRALILVGREAGPAPVPPGRLSEPLGCSPSYLAKTLGLLARAGILVAVRGARGGVRLARRPEEISLLDVVEACQGVVQGRHCAEVDLRRTTVCAFHEAMHEIHRTTVAVLSRWTLRDLLERPRRPREEAAVVPCKMTWRDEPPARARGGRR